MILSYEGASRQRLAPAVLGSEPRWIRVVYRHSIIDVSAIWPIITVVIAISGVGVVATKNSVVKSAAIPEYETAWKRAERSGPSKSESSGCTEGWMRSLGRSRTEGLTAQGHPSTNRTSALDRGATECYSARCGTSIYVCP